MSYPSWEARQTNWCFRSVVFLPVVLKKQDFLLWEDFSDLLPPVLLTPCFQVYCIFSSFSKYVLKGTDWRIYHIWNHQQYVVVIKKKTRKTEREAKETNTTRNHNWYISKTEKGNFKEKMWIIKYVGRKVFSATCGTALFPALCIM